jgi:iron complex outermembrane receptor protein
MKFRSLLATSAIALLMQSPALAQDAAAEGDEAIQDIVVTAQRREENVQKTALSIEVFSGDDLRASGVGKAARPRKFISAVSAISV